MSTINARNAAAGRWLRKEGITSNDFLTISDEAVEEWVKLMEDNDYSVIVR